MAYLRNHEREGRIWNLSIPPTQKLILLALNNYADSEGGSCFPSTSRIAKDTGYCRQTVSQSIGKLVDAGLLTKHARFNQGQSSNDYQINFHAMSPSNVKKSQHDVKKLTPLSIKTTPPVVEDDTPCQLKRHPLSFKTTPPVVEDDTIISNYQNQLPSPFNACRQEGKKSKKGRGEEAKEGYQGEQEGIEVPPTAEGELAKGYREWLWREVSQRPGVRSPGKLYEHIVGQGESSREWSLWREEQPSDLSWCESLIEEMEAIHGA